jgi:DNA-binding NtrC family response regulator
MHVRDSRLMPIGLTLKCLSDCRFELLLAFFRPIELRGKDRISQDRRAELWERRGLMAEVDTIRDRERDLILAALNRYGGSRRKVIKALRISRKLLTRKLAQYAAAGFSVPQAPPSNPRQ